MTFTAISDHKEIVRFLRRFELDSFDDVEVIYNTDKSVGLRLHFDDDEDVRIYLVRRDPPRMFRIEKIDNATKVVEGLIQKENEGNFLKFRDIPQFIDEGNYRADVNFEHLDSWIAEFEDEMGLQLNPDFQRGHVWSEDQQVKFVEFILQGGKTGRDIYFNHPDWHDKNFETDYHDFVCVDGLQRITAIRRFLHDEIKAFGQYYSQFEGHTDLIRHNMTVHVNSLRTKKEVLTWYVQMNAGGTPHTSEEIDRVQKMIAAES